MREILGTLYTWVHVMCIQNFFKRQNSCINNELLECQMRISVFLCWDLYR